MSKKIIDCFMFYNEIELLTYRLNILNDVVDYFVIVESTNTLSGKEKKLYFEENKDLFKAFENKIIHIIVDDFEFKYPNIDYSKRQQWLNETFQRSCISRGLDKISLVDKDLIIITDLDEIPNPKTLHEIKNDNNIVVEFNSLQMDLYYYNLNVKSIYDWTLGKIISFKKYNDLHITCQQIREQSCQLISDCGWHLSYFGDSKFIKNKIENFGHQEFNNEHYTNIGRIEECIQNGNDLFGNDSNWIKIKLKDNDNLPHEYEKYLKNFIVL